VIERARARTSGERLNFMVVRMNGKFGGIGKINQMAVPRKEGNP
jgi:hypothetical protein